jgi:hypothetical protein
MPGDWWSASRALFDVVASIGGRHTDIPERAWFAVWDGSRFLEHDDSHRVERPPVRR